MFCIFDFFFHFPFISYGRSFLTEDHECDYFFYIHLAFSNHALNFFVCVHIPSAIKVTEFRTILVKLRFLKIQNVKFSGQKWPKTAQGLRHCCFSNRIVFTEMKVLFCKHRICVVVSSPRSCRQVSAPCHMPQSEAHILHGAFPNPRDLTDGTLGLLFGVGFL